MKSQNLRLLLITAPFDAPFDGLDAAFVDAVVLQSSGESVPVASVVAALPDLPIVVLADTDRDETLRLIGAGADDVLTLGTPMTEVAGAVERAIVRRGRDGVRSSEGRPAAMGDQGREGDREHLVSPDFAVEALTLGAPDAPIMPPLLESMFRLAGGVAQDFNNLLMIMEGNAERLLAKLESEDPLRERVEAISAAARRGVMLTTKLLAFGRQQRLVQVPVDLNTIVTDASPVLRRRLGPDVRLVTQLDPDLPQVRADRTQLMHVLSNLARTAAEVMPSGGTFTIKTDRAIVDAEMRRSRPWLASGPYVRIQLTDTGAGIAENALPHVFEPFFAPKNGRGDGLDLPSVYGVVKQSGGFIWFDSRVEHGTRVTILLPPLGVSQPRSEGSAEGPHVLLVEDDEEVRELLLDVLTSHGLQVTAVGSAEDALLLSTQGEFDLLVTDIGLPGANGPQLARQIRRRSPHMPLLFISGHSGDIFEEEGDFGAPSAFLQKPFSSRTLFASLQDLLGQRAATE